MLSKKAPARNTILLAGLFFAVAILQLFTLDCPDLVWMVQNIDEVRGGATLYRDIYEINPPLIYWLYILPVRLAFALGLSPVLTMKAFVFAAIMASVALSARILAATPVWAEKRHELVLGLAAVLLLVPDSFATFAEREHLLIIFILPYLLLNLPSVTGAPKPIRMLAGIAAGIGFSIKPYFALIWLALMGYKLVGKGRKAIQLPDILVAATAAVYLLCVLLFVPEYLSELQQLGSLYRRYHGLQNTQQIALWFVSKAAIGAALAVAAGILRKVPEASFRRDITYLSLIAAAGFAEALLQYNNWDYIIYPFQALLLLLLPYPILLRPPHPLIGALILVVFLLPKTPWTDPRQDYYKVHYNQFVEGLGEYAKSRDLYMLSVFFSGPQFYRTQSPMHWRSSFPMEGFLLAGIMEPSKQNGLPTLQVRPGEEAHEQWLLGQLAADITRKNPDLIVMEQGWDLFEPEEEFFDMQAWVKRDARLSTILKQYRLVKSMHLCYKNLLCTNYLAFSKKP